MKLMGVAKIVFVTIVCSSCSVSSRDGSSPITVSWSPGVITETLGYGHQISVDATFRCSENAKNVDIVIAPELIIFVSVTPNHIANVSKGINNNIQITISVPSSALLGLHEGIIQMRAEGSTIQSSLQIGLNIVVVAKLVGPGGGTLASPDGLVLLSIPSEALESEEFIAITYTDDEGNLGQLGEFIVLEPDGQVFLVPVALKIGYTETSIPSYASEEGLFLGTLIKDYGGWEILDNSVVDTVNNTVSSQLSHFSTIGVLYSSSTNDETFSLAFPIDDDRYPGPFSTPISAAFDHSQGRLYAPDYKVSVFTGETAIGKADRSNYSTWYFPSASGKCYGFKNKCESNFYANGLYTGGDYLYYDAHRGIDYSVSSVVVCAAEAGIVSLGKQWSGTGDSKVWLNQITIDHLNGYRTIYLHLNERWVSDGEEVIKGQPIGISGDMSGPPDLEDAPHLHFEVWHDDVPVDPYGWGGGFFYPDPYKLATNRFLWEQGESILYIDIPQEQKCDTNQDGLPDEIWPWLSFIEGDPGSPGDGKLIDANTGGIWPDSFELKPPIPLSAFKEGFTIATFAPPEETFSASFSIVSSLSHPCHAHFGAGPGAPIANVVVNGVIGEVQMADPLMIQGYVYAANQFNPGCNLTIDDLFIGEIHVFGSSGVLTSLDAFAILPGQYSMPSTRPGSDIQSLLSIETLTRANSCLDRRLGPHPQKPTLSRGSGPPEKLILQQILTCPSYGGMDFFDGSRSISAVISRSYSIRQPTAHCRERALSSTTD